MSRAPLLPPKWDGVYRATQPYHCLQNAGFLVYGTEDCLKINVYVPTTEFMANRPLPVMVFIHGGAFILGDGGKLLQGPHFLVKHGVVLVTFNYRLGALGFMCLDIEDAPGNAGLKDQIAALKWVKQNIAAFGGDPDNVTVFGVSAGAVSVSLLLASEATDGLFKGAIVQSGSSLANWAINRNPIRTASLLAKKLGFSTEDPHELYNIFMKLTSYELTKLQVEQPIDLFFDTEVMHLPCVEKKFPDVEQVLTDLPFNLLNKKPKNIPVIYGTTSKEGLFVTYYGNKRNYEKRNDKYLFTPDVEFASIKEENEAANRVHEFYFGEKLAMKELVTSASELYTHLYFEIPAILESELMTEKSNASVYNYYFNYSGGRNFMKHMTGNSNDDGACHGDDILYLFEGYIWPYWISEKDQRMIDFMTKMWTNFAKYGNPTPKVTTDLPVRWTPSTSGDLKFLYIEDDLKMGSMPHPKAYKLWKDIYTQYNTGIKK